MNEIPEPGIYADETMTEGVTIGDIGRSAPSSNIAMALGFITEFNENVAIFSSISGPLLENMLLMPIIVDQVISNRLSIDHNRRNIDALASIVSRLSGGRSDDGYSSDEPIEPNNYDFVP